MEILAVDLESDPPEFDEDNRMPRPQDILQICGSLVRIDKTPQGRDSLGRRAEVQTLTAAHASVVEFLKEERVRIGRNREVSYTRAAVNLEMAETCLAYLLDLVGGEVVLSDEAISSYPFARHSAELWDDFYREVVTSPEKSAVDMTRVNSLVMRLFESRDYVWRWLRLCDPDDKAAGVRYSLPISYVKSILYYAALLGLPDIVDRLIRNGHSVNAVVDGGCGSPLVAACVRGRESIVSLLLGNGADPNLPGNEYRGCPLAAAIEQKNTRILELLLKHKGINVNTRRFHPDYASAAQIKRKITEIEEADDRADIEKAVGDMRIREDTHHDNENSDSQQMTLEREDQYASTITAAESLLYIAAKSGSLEIVNALLEAGANPNICGGSEWTALQVACLEDSVDIVESLLQKGADAKIHGGNSSSPLRAACDCPSIEIVRKLLKVPVDVNYVGEKSLFKNLFAWHI